MSLIRVSEVSKQESGRVILNNVSCEIKAGQNLAIAGETGSGKSSLLKAIAGLLQPDKGHVYFNDEKVLGPEEKLIPGHKRIAYLSQHFELPNYYTVANVLAYENRLSVSEATILYKVCRIDHLLERDTKQLSGGEKQRISLARALIKSPQVLLLDEPFSNMDMIHKSLLKSVINDVIEQLQVTCVLVSHDPLDTLSWAHNMLILKDGAVIQQGAPDHIYRHPVNEYTGALLGTYNLIHPNDLFTSLPGVSLKGKSLFVRPEQFKITEARFGAMKGEVKAAFFYGSYYELTVQLLNAEIKVKSESLFNKGDSIYLSLSREYAWYIN